MRAWYGRTLFSGYLDVDSELRREASCLRGGSWVSNVSRGEMFEGIVAPTFLGWDQHGLRCLLFGVSSKFEGTHASPQYHPEHGMDGHCFRGWFDWQLTSKLEGGSVDACALVCAVLHPRAGTQETGLSTPSVSVARLVPWVFTQLEMW